MLSLRYFLGENDMMAYLTMMANRLLELHRVLKPTGSLYLHCSPTASHYLKLVLDGVFGIQSFINEIIWKRADTVKGNFGQGSKMFGSNTDAILFYRKTSENTFNPQFTEYSEEYVEGFYKFVEPETGRRFRLISMTGPGGAAKGNPQYDVMGVTRYWRYSKQSMQKLIDLELVVQTNPGNVPQRKLYLDQGKGVAIQSLWDDIPGLHSQAAERLGYPTQKPLALLERIINASSNPGDLILDPFCGCGTAVHAAQKLGRRWIGIDITHLAISLVEKRLHDAFPAVEVTVEGTPEDLAGARDLANRDKYQFQWWACSLVGAQPYKGKRKGADGGIDGQIFFSDIIDGKPKTQKIIVSVKGGENLHVNMIRELGNVVTQNDVQMGFFVTLNNVSEPMARTAVKEGFYHAANGKDYPRIQILTIEGLLSGTERPEYMDYRYGADTFKQAPSEKIPNSQISLF